MRSIGNILWHVPFLGFIQAGFTFLLGSLMVLTVVGAPVGLGLIEYSKFLLTPYTKSMIDGDDLNSAYGNDQGKNPAWKYFSIAVRICYFPIGLLLAFGACLQTIGLMITIIGFPLAMIMAKSIPTYFNPVNKKCVHYLVAIQCETKAEEEKANAEVNKIKQDKSAAA